MAGRVTVFSGANIVAVLRLDIAAGSGSSPILFCPYRNPYVKDPKNIDFSDFCLLILLDHSLKNPSGEAALASNLFTAWLQTINRCQKPSTPTLQLLE